MLPVWTFGHWLFECVLLYGVRSGQLSPQRLLFLYLIFVVVVKARSVRVPRSLMQTYGASLQVRPSECLHRPRYHERHHGKEVASEICPTKTGVAILC